MEQSQHRPLTPRLPAVDAIRRWVAISEIAEHRWAQARSMRRRGQPKASRHTANIRGNETMHHPPRLLQRHPRRTVRGTGPLVACLLSLATIAVAEEIVYESGPLTFEPGPVAADCDCRQHQQPPWHGNVAGPCCNRPCCPPPNMFHADAWGSSEPGRRHGSIAWNCRRPSRGSTAGEKVSCPRPSPSPCPGATTAACRFSPAGSPGRRAVPAARPPR